MPHLAVPPALEREAQGRVRHHLPAARAQAVQGRAAGTSGGAGSKQAGAGRWPQPAAEACARPHLKLGGAAAPQPVGGPVEVGEVGGLWQQPRLQRRRGARRGGAAKRQAGGGLRWDACGALSTCSPPDTSAQAWLLISFSHLERKHRRHSRLVRRQPVAQVHKAAHLLRRQQRIAHVGHASEGPSHREADADAAAQMSPAPARCGPAGTPRWPGCRGAPAAPSPQALAAAGAPTGPWCGGAAADWKGERDQRHLRCCLKNFGKAAHCS